MLSHRIKIGPEIRSASCRERRSWSRSRFTSGSGTSEPKRKGERETNKNWCRACKDWITPNTWTKTFTSCETRNISRKTYFARSIRSRATRSVSWSNLSHSRHRFPRYRPPLCRVLRATFISINRKISLGPRDSSDIRMHALTRTSVLTNLQTQKRRDKAFLFQFI